MKWNGSPTVTSKALTTLIIVTLVLAPPLTTVLTNSQSQQTSNTDNTARKGAPTTDIYWARAFGGGNEDIANSVVQTSDGGYAVAGRTSSFGSGFADVWVLKLNSTGSIEWQKTYGIVNYDGANCVAQTSDGGYIVAGYENDSLVDPSFGGPGKVWVLKLSSEGSVEWQKVYESIGESSRANSVVQTSDGGYIVAGYIAQPGAIFDVWVLKLNSTGSIEWQKAYGGDYLDEAHSIKETSDGGYIVAGETQSFVTGNVTWHGWPWDTHNVWVLKLNSTGSVEWQKTYGGIYPDEAHSVVQTSDGGYIVAGHTYSFGSGGSDVWVLKLDSTGSIEWQKAYGSSNYTESSYSVEQTSDGGYVVAGRVAQPGGGTGFWVFRLDSNGSIEWQGIYGGDYYEEARSIQQTSDGGYIAAGFTESFGAGLQDFYVLKLNSTGSLLWNEDSGASTQTTNAVSLDSDATVTETSAIPVEMAVIVQDTWMSPQVSSAKITVLAGEVAGGDGTLVFVLPVVVGVVSVSSLVALACVWQRRVRRGSKR